MATFVPAVHPVAVGTCEAIEDPAHAEHEPEIDGEEEAGEQRVEDASLDENLQVEDAMPEGGIGEGPGDEEEPEEGDAQSLGLLMNSSRTPRSIATVRTGRCDQTIGIDPQKS